MKFRILEVGEPRGIQTGVLDDRLYSITAVTEVGTKIIVDVPVCFNNKSIKILLEQHLNKHKAEKKPVVKVGDVL